MRCTICEQDIKSAEKRVATTDGAVVHIACADREATMAWVRRQHWALAHGLLLVVAIATLLWIGMTRWLVVLIGAVSITHPLIHRRLWHYMVRDIRRRLGEHLQ